MNTPIAWLLYLHIAVGIIALITGAMAIFTKKGKGKHRSSGKIYFWAMTLVFITGLIVAGYRTNTFLFMISFLSYYCVFAGVRILHLKKLHRSQSPRWFDWLAGIINTVANLIFLGMGIRILIVTPHQVSAIVLYTGFGLGGLSLSYTNLKPFLMRPDNGYHWYLTHIGNMMGGYIATTTAFFSTVVSRTEIMPPVLAFMLPAALGVPALLYWLRRTEQKFTRPKSAGVQS
jgi:uncharacterized membrane protein